jgi:hypothetical protein
MQVLVRPARALSDSEQRPPAPPPRLHPASARSSLMPADDPEFGEFVADPQEHGLLQPIVLHDGRVLDGCSLYRAWQHGGIEPCFRRG